MDLKVNLGDLTTPEDVQKLTAILSEIADQLDILYTTTAPSGNISCRQGKLALYKNGSTYELWQNTDGGLTWQRMDFGAGVSTFAGLTDVQFSSLADGDLAAYEASSLKWKNKTKSDLGLVLTSGDQTIAGVKTFSSFPVGPSSAPTANYEFANKKYVDDNFSRKVIYTADATWTCPTGVTKIYITMVAGGGAGGGGVDGQNYGAGGGGGGCGCYRVPYTVVPGNNYAVVVGEGGNPVTAGNGGNGEASSFNVTLSVSGGVGGKQAGGSPTGGAGGSLSSVNGTNGGTSSAGTGGSFYSVAGGNGGTGGTGANAGGGGGGGSIFGVGGDGGTYDNSGYDGEGHGAGGGGGGVGNSHPGGYGTDGLVIIEY